MFDISSVLQGRSGTCKNCVTCVSQIGNTKDNPELEKSRKFVTHLIIFKKSGQTVKFNLETNHSKSQIFVTSLLNPG